MTLSDRFDRRLEAGLDEVAHPSFPDYFGDILAVTSRTRQRPAWVFPGRWFPMVDIARRAPFAPTVPWRMVAVLIALIVAAAVATAAFIGSQPRYPPPFGVARNGLIGFTENGDVMVTDPATDVTRTIATGQASSPRFSLDGRRIAYFEATADEAKHLFVSDVASGQARQLTTDPIDNASTIAWSPDGTLIAIDTGDTAGSGTTTARILIASTDGSGVRPLDVGMPAAEPQWAPPDGRDILFRGFTGGRVALFLVHPDGTGLRPLGVTTTAAADDLAMAAWSPDGTRIAYVYGFVAANGAERARLHLVRADGTDDSEALPRSVVSEYGPVWSPDGTLIALHRWRITSIGEVERYISIVTVDGSRPVLDSDVPRTDLQDFGWNLTWAPDGRTLIAERTASSTVFSIDPLTGRATPLAISTYELPTMQRLIP